MESIINPWVIYIIGLVEPLRVFFVVGAVIFLCLLLAVFLDNIRKRWLAPIILCLLVFFALAVLIPTKATLVGMYVANEVTYDRVGKGGKIVKDAKDSIKQDVMDIIDSFKE